ncbi:MAG TPA: hypothetical protein VII67_01655 [Acidimicrobiales bacterium]
MSYPVQSTFDRLRRIVARDGAAPVRITTPRESRASAVGFRGCALLVTLAVVYNLWELRAERLVVAYPNDSSLHYQMLSVAHHLLAEGQFPLDHWYPYLSLGSPFFVQYQSASAILGGALAGVVGTHLAFSWSLYLLLSLWPICVYYSARLLGRSRWESALAAAISPLLFSVTGRGYEDQAYNWLGSGLWSQLWAMWTLPLAWGFGWRFISQRRYLFAAVATLALTIAFHFVTAYLAALALIVWVLVKPREIVRRIGRAWLVGVGALLATLWVTLPLLVDTKWLAINGFQVGTYIDDSYGARKILLWLVTGQIYDYGRFPVVTIFVGVGLVVCVKRFRTDERARALIGVWVLSLLLFFGRPTLGPVLNLLPGSSNILFQRYISGVQLAGLFLAGVGAVCLARLLADLVWRMWRETIDQLSGRSWLKRLRTPAILAVTILVLAPAWTQLDAYNSSNNVWIQYQRVADQTQGAQVNELIAIAQSRGGGRIYAGMPSNWGRTFYIGDVPVYIYLEGRGIDAVGFTLRTSSLMTMPEAYFDESNPGDYKVFGVGYILTRSHQSSPVAAHLVKRTAGYALWSVTSGGLVQVVDTTTPMVVTGSDIGTQSSVFLSSALPGEDVYPTVGYDGRPAAVSTLAFGALPKGPAGEVLREKLRLFKGYARATVVANRTAVVLLKSSFDPGWTVTVDGETVTPEMIAPALVGVTVSAGRHVVVFQFKGYSSYPLLFIISFLTLVGFGFAAFLWRRYARRRRRVK